MLLGYAAFQPPRGDRKRQLSNGKLSLSSNKRLVYLSNCVTQGPRGDWSESHVSQLGDTQHMEPRLECSSGTSTVHVAQSSGYVNTHQPLSSLWSLQMTRICLSVVNILVSGKLSCINDSTKALMKCSECDETS